MIIIIFYIVLSCQSSSYFAVTNNFLHLSTKLLITEIELDIDSPNAYFPEWKAEDWKEESRVKSSENDIEFSFVEYIRD